ncbi:GspH/FimT family protein [Crenobacter sp. SG2305]|uniref:GspH/FimT family pseudopilin n=1 Tax=Crenobacter oryzisoli TaxID=3056844 RepID=UPI0025AA8BA2|nr:GspH/FimT family protein [Crenobacter sp. SG2305]MDN0084144.1 GspH/FimT family protein [Crenobacter sp. SG2305]
MRLGVYPCGGFTLLELLLVMALAALLVTMAADAMPAWLARHRLTLLGQQLAGQLHYARSEALRGNRPVYLCALNAKSNLDLQGCFTKHRKAYYVWDEGALVYADNPLANGNRPAVYDSGERLRAVLFGAGVTVSAPLSQLRFDADGLPDEAAVFQLQDLATGLCRPLVLSGAGRARLCAVGEVGCGGC